MWGGKLGKQIIDLIHKEDPDVVCFQEAMEFAGGKTFLFEDIDSIKQKTGYVYSDFRGQLGYNLMNRKAKMGLSIFSKRPIVKTDDFYTRLNFSDNFDLLDGDYNVQNLQRVTLDWNGEKLHILNHHGHHVPGHKNGDEETIRQCTMIADYIKKLDGYTVLCGDFNLLPNSNSLEIINSILDNHIKNSGTLTTRTSLTDKKEVCDYIFTSRNIVTNNLLVHDDVVSDHKAITIEINKKTTPL